MGSDWKTTNIDSIQSPSKGAIAIGPFGSRMKSDCYVESGVPVIRGTNITSGSAFSGEFVFITEEKANSLGSSNVYGGDLVFPHRGSIGEVGIVPEGTHYVLSSSLMKLSCNTQKADPKFIYYFFKSHIGKHELLKNASQVGTPGIGQPLSSLKSCILKLPHLNTQKSIAHILSSLDNKIELNRQINETLESMAQALFKSWFIDFDPVIDNALAAGNEIPQALAKKAAARKALGNTRKPLPENIQKHFPNSFQYTEEMGWIPEGWKTSKLSELLQVKYGKDHKKLDDGEIPVYGSGGLMRRVNQSLYEGESILIPRKGTLTNLMYVDEEFWSVDTMFFSIPKHPKVAKYLFYFLKRLDFASMNVGSAVPSMTTKVLNDINTLKPSESVLALFDNEISHFFIKKAANNTSSNTLEKLRDTLLPKLLSGELRIPDAEKLLEETL